MGNQDGRGGKLFSRAEKMREFEKIWQPYRSLARMNLLYLRHIAGSCSVLVLFGLALQLFAQVLPVFSLNHLLQPRNWQIITLRNDYALEFFETNLSRRLGIWRGLFNVRLHYSWLRGRYRCRLLFSISRSLILKQQNLEHWRKLTINAVIQNFCPQTDCSHRFRPVGSVELG